MEILTISGPTGSGKSSIESLIAGLYGYESPKGVTTRPPRDDNEFMESVTPEAFRTMRDAGDLATWFELDNVLYGIKVADLKAALDEGKNVVTVQNGEALLRLRDWAAANDIKVRSVLLDISPGECRDRILSDNAYAQMGVSDLDKLEQRLHRGYREMRGELNLVADIDYDIVLNDAEKDEGTQALQIAVTLHHHRKSEVALKRVQDAEKALAEAHAILRRVA